MTAALAVPVYDANPWEVVIYPPTGYQSFRDQLEGWLYGPAPQLHNRVHVWVGGSMLPMTSPDDPVFFLHHANVDRIWSQWQLLHSSSTYLPTSGVPGVGLTDPMWPWTGSTKPQTVTPNNVLSTIQLGYIYDTEIQRTTPFGGPHGDNFDDSLTIQSIPTAVTSITATWNSAITFLKIGYADGTTCQHGQIVKDNTRTINVPAGKQLGSITVYTNKQNSKTGVVLLDVVLSDNTLAGWLGPWAIPRGSNSQRFVVPANSTFAGFTGRASNRIYSLGIVTIQAPEGAEPDVDAHRAKGGPPS